MINAPYNFVPLNKEVFYPSWDKDVSHDIPFEDGESGMIDIEIFTETPIFIRNHYVNGDSFYTDKKENKVSTEFCHFKDADGGKQYYIPSSSIKGMIRNIIEIMSFSKINVDEKTLSKPLSVRDMTPQQYCKDNNITKMGDCPNHLKQELYSKPIVAIAKKCGFLVKKGEEFFIEDCGSVVTIKENEIQYLIPTYSKDIETAKEKYSQFGHNDSFPFNKMQKDRRTVATYSQKGEIGSLIMTGFIDNKKNEFIFKSNGRKIPLSQPIYDNFEKVYFKNEEAIDGQYWKEQWKNGAGRKIPIFYIEENNSISAIGLTQIFKLAYKKSLLDAISQTIDQSRLDLAETIFGTVKEDNPLKGRVQFSHLKSTHVSYEAEKSEILGSPQATYYPNYLNQTQTNGNTVNKYTTLMDGTAQISGYKRYPLHKSIKKSFIPKEEKTDIQTKFKPLSTGCKFKGKVRFHNLKKAEIGALLSALSFHGNSGYRHNLGMAKALGYGKIKIDIDLKNLEYSQEEYLKAYEEEMTIFIDEWINTPQIKELFAMANNKIVNDKSLEYQKLENPTTRDIEKNDFNRAKKNREYLKRYSETGNVNQESLNSLIDKSEVEKEKKVREEEKIKIEKLEKERIAQELILEEKKKKEQEELKNELDKWNSIHIPSNQKYLKDTLKKFIDDYPNSSKIEEAKRELEALTTSKLKVINQKLDFSNATDAKSIERAMKPIQNPNDEDKDKVEEAIKRVYPNLNTKKKKQFAKSKLMVRWLGKDRFNGLLNG